MKNRKLLTFCIVFIVIAVIVALTLTIILPSINKKQKYQAAEELMQQEKYEEAKEIYEELEGYQNSKKFAEECQDKIIEKKQKELWNYIGTYSNVEERINEINGYEEPFGDQLDIININIEQIEFQFTRYSRKVDMFYAKGKLIDGKYKFSGEDSWNNIVEGELYFENNRVIITINNILESKTNFDMDQTKVEFDLNSKRKLEYVTHY